MRKIIVAVMATFSGLVLLFSYHTSTNSTTSPQASGASSDPPTKATTHPATRSSSASPTASSSSSSTSSSGTFTGTAVSSPYGDVQVQITVSNGKITSAEAIRYPNAGNHDQEINSYAIPILSSETVKAQSATIDAVSGATFTSAAYVESLQSALDKAHL